MIPAAALPQSARKSQPVHIVCSVCVVQIAALIYRFITVIKRITHSCGSPAIDFSNLQKVLALTIRIYQLRYNCIGCQRGIQHSFKNFYCKVKYKYILDLISSTAEDHCSKSFAFFCNNEKESKIYHSKYVQTCI